jgi:hypothetical protein
MATHYNYPFWADAVTDTAFDLILLNSDRPALNSTSEIFKRLWERGTIRVVADGGANNLAMALGAPHVAALPHTDLPTMIAGDLDSLLPDVEAQYAALAVWHFCACPLAENISVHIVPIFLHGRFLLSTVPVRTRRI